MDKTQTINRIGFWVKVVGMLQHNWAVIDTNNEGGIVVNFISDNADIFDCLHFNSQKEATDSLLHNEFIQLEVHGMREILLPPQKPYGKFLKPIYSSGDYWKDFK